jgi:hypothetical protein
MHTLNPLDLTDTQGGSSLIGAPLSGASNPSAFPSNHVGGRSRSKRTFKKFMRGKKNYKKSVRKYLSSSSGMFSKMMRKIKGSSSKKRR